MRWFFYLILLLPVFAPAQNLKAVPIAETSMAMERFIGVDEYKNLYFINANVFHKKSTEKNLRFSDLQLGPISSADIINPLRITLFYEKFNTAVILDNALNEITRVDFNKLEDFRNISHVRTASDQRLWIYNADLRQLELFDYRNNRVTANSPPLAHAALIMASNFNTCWIYTDKKLQAYNHYGSLLYSIRVNNLDQIFINQGDILALQNGKLLFIDQDKHIFRKVDLDENALDQLYWAREILYIYNGSTLDTYKFKPPKT